MLTAKIAAIRSRATAQARNYTVESWGEYPAFTVQHVADATRRYIVDMNFRTCECKAFEKDGYCKHYALCQQEREYLARLEAQAEAEAQAEESAFEAFMHREHPAVPC
ncbi:MAG: SWIM zinc finger family protein [Armatimonadetes bacterium]|nr:SWIM zinc finger family protein [Armatimonadota bacterium]